MRIDLSTAAAPGAPGALPPLPRAFLAGRDLDLLAPLRFLVPSRLDTLGPLPALTPAARRARAELAAGLAISNRSYGHADADGAARRLADPATRVVVTGQQPGLFGGPLMTFAKLVAAARWAAALTAAGEPAVAVFWVATEDHDYAEVASTTVLAAGGPRRFDLGPDTQPLLPVGMRALSPSVTTVLRHMAEVMPGANNAAWLRRLGDWYQPSARFGEAFCRALAGMLGAHCPLLLDAMHPALKAAERPWLGRLIEHRHELEEALARQDSAVLDRGYELRVTPQRGASPLFLLRHGARRRIEWRGADEFALRGKEGGRQAAKLPGATRAPAPQSTSSVAELLRTLEENPTVVSPGVLARPAIADAVLGTSLQVLGPGELSYMAQASAVYPLLDISAPQVALRPQTLVLDADQVPWLAELDLSLAEVLGDRHHLDRKLADRAGNDFVAPVRERLAAALAELEGPALAADPKLERPLVKTREQVLRAVDLFAEKVLPVLARGDEEQTRRIEALRETCLPGGKLQERLLSSAHFAGKYGDRLAAGFWEQLDLDPARISVIVP